MLMQLNTFRLSCVALVVFSITTLSVANSLAAMCPFCSAINLTFTEQMASNDIVVIGKLLEVPPPSDDPNAELPRAEFEVVSVLKGDKWVEVGMKFKTLLVGRQTVGQQFLVMGVDPPTVTWSTPMKSSQRVIDYLKQIRELPESGAKRLTFFQDYFEDRESVLAFDAYDEFARAPYQDLIDMKDQMKREQLIEWINSTDTSANRRRLYFTMLGVCGNRDSDVKMLEGFIKSGDRKKQAGLDALIACYLNLKGAEGVALVEETFIKDTEVEYVDTLAAVSALRFHGTEMNLIPKERIVAAVRHLLDRPKMADMIIPDLARWEDWSVMDRLVQMFKDADEETNWLRVPVITYLRACPKPAAKKHIEELAKIDPDAVRRADFFLDFTDSEMDDDAEDDTVADKTKADQESADQNAGGAGDEASGGDRGDGQPNQTHTKLENDSPTTQHVVKKVPLDSPSESLAASDAPAVETELLTNPEQTTFVSTSVDSVSSPEQLAQSTVPPVLTASTPQTNYTLTVIMAPFAICCVIFLLLWSVISGRFERLIF